MRTTLLASVASSLPAASTVPQEPLAIPPRQRWRWVAIACGLASFAAAISVWALRHAGGWLVVQDGLAPAHAIVVLSGGMPYRAREAARILVWHRVAGNDPAAVVRYVADDPFDAAHWWRATGDALDVVREFLGLANAAFGFPLRPEPH